MHDIDENELISNHKLYNLPIDVIKSNSKLYAELFFDDIFFEGISNETTIKYLNYIDGVLVIEGGSFFSEFCKLFKKHFNSIPKHIIAKFVAISYSFELVSLILLSNEVCSPLVNNTSMFIKYLYELKLRLTKTAYTHIILNDYGTFSNKVNLLNRMALRNLIYDK